MTNLNYLKMAILKTFNNCLIDNYVITTITLHDTMNPENKKLFVNLMSVNEDLTVKIMLEKTKYNKIYRVYNTEVLYKNEKTYIGKYEIKMLYDVNLTLNNVLYGLELTEGGLKL